MTLEEVLDRLDRSPIKVDYIIALKYKYNHEDIYEYSNEILLFDGAGDYIWQNDWYEGQEEVYVVGVMPLQEVEVYGHYEII